MSTNPATTGNGRFTTTHWSVVLTAGSPESSRYQEALETLCQTYWFPLYAYLRRQGYDRHQAEDYTQAFFTRLLEKHGLRLADPKRGKFRSYLLGALKHFLADERDRAQALKRGGKHKLLSIDSKNAENQYALEPTNQLSPEKLFERSWALTMLKKAMSRLEAESASLQKQKVFEHLVVYLAPTEKIAPYREVAARLSMTEAAVKVAVNRLKKRYRELLRDEIAQTVTNEEQVEEELCELFTALSG